MHDPWSPPDRKTIRSSASPSSGRVVSELLNAAATTSIESHVLVERARGLLKARRAMGTVMPKDLFRDSAWDIMLELYICAVEGGIVYVKQMIIASGERPATAIRLLARLEDAGFLQRKADQLDHRRMVVSLTSRGQHAMELLLSHLSDQLNATSIENSQVDEVAGSVKGFVGGSGR